MPAKDPELSFFQKMKNSRFLFPIFGLISFVIGSMYLGWATPTEAAAFGVLVEVHNYLGCYYLLKSLGQNRNHYYFD